MAVKRTISEKENTRRYYAHEKPEYLPSYWAGIFTKHPILGFLERPDDGGNKDWFGVEYLSDPVVKSAVPNHHPSKIVITDITKWREQVKIPDIDNWDWEKAAAIDKIDNKAREEKLVSLLIQCGIFERFHSLLGMQQAYEALIMEPEESKTLIAELGDYKLKLYGKLIEYYKPDIIRQHDDYGTQTGMQISPQMWRELIKPQIKRFVDLCHSKGVFYEQHSCGKIDEIIPDFCEIGVDSWQGMHFVHDVPALKKMTGMKLGYHMGMPVQKYQTADVQGKLTEEDLRRDVRELILSCAGSGCYMPVYSVIGPEWWGTKIMLDEIGKCRDIVEY